MTLQKNKNEPRSLCPLLPSIQEKLEWAAVVPQEGAVDGDSLSSSISSISDKGPTRAKKHAHLEIKANLETAPEVDYESSIDGGFLEAGVVRQGGEANTRTEKDINRSSAALTGCESSAEQGNNRARSTEIKRKSIRERDRHRTSDLYRRAKVGRVDRRGMDWEVAVVMRSEDAIDMVRALTGMQVRWSPHVGVGSESPSSTCRRYPLEVFVGSRLAVTPKTFVLEISIIDVCPKYFCEYLVNRPLPRNSVLLR